MDVAEITLRIVSADDVILHEGQDPLVVGKLADRLKADRILRNPPIVRYIVLDGATRTARCEAWAFGTLWCRLSIMPRGRSHSPPGII
jgi:hypothetical protein